MGRITPLRAHVGLLYVRQLELGQMTLCEYKKLFKNIQLYFLQVGRLI